MSFRPSDSEGEILLSMQSCLLCMRNALFNKILVAALPSYDRVVNVLLLSPPLYNPSPCA
jgi:hypothetical protein